MKKIISFICLLVVLPVFVVTADGEPPRIPCGHFIRLDKGEFRETSPDKYPITKRGDVTTMFAEIKRGNEQKIVVHFHGGLVSVEDAFTKPIEKGIYAAYDKEAYPIFFIYESGFGYAFKNIFRKFHAQYGHIVDDTKTRIIEHARAEQRTIPPSESRIYSFLKSPEINVNTSHTDLSEELLETYKRKYEKMSKVEKKKLEKEIDGKLEEAERNLTILLDNNQGFETRVLEAEIKMLKENSLIADYSAWLALKVFYHVLERTITGRHHNLTPTIQEELLNGVKPVWWIIYQGWKTIKKTTKEAFVADEALYGGTAFLKELDALVNEKPGIKVMLVGHSTGAIYICNLLEAAKKKKKYPSLANFKFDVIFEAPACTFKRFNETIKKAGDKIGNFRMFALHDDWEKEDKVGFELLYSNSMLYFVSSVAERSWSHDKPIVGMERYFSETPLNYGEKYKNVKTVKEFLGYVSTTENGDTVFSKTAVGAADGWEITAETHGQCDDDAELLKSLEAIIAKWLKN